MFDPSQFGQREKIDFGTLAQLASKQADINEIQQAKQEKLRNSQLLAQSIKDATKVTGYAHNGIPATPAENGMFQVPDKGGYKMVKPEEVEPITNIDLPAAFSKYMDAGGDPTTGIHGLSSLDLFTHRGEKEAAQAQLAKEQREFENAKLLKAYEQRLNPLKPYEQLIADTAESAGSILPWKDSAKELKAKLSANILAKPEDAASLIKSALNQ